MRSKYLLILAAIVLLVAVSCQPAAAPTPTEAPIVPTNTVPPTPIPTATQTPIPPTVPPTAPPIPTETIKPSITPLPEGIFFRDEFEGGLQPAWEWQDENPAKWTITEDGWLQIVGEWDTLLGDKKQNNMLWYPLPEGDFVITVHLKTKPFADFHQAGIFIYEDNDNYITINRGFCSPCGGSGFYMDYKISGTWGNYIADTEVEDVYLRLERKADMVSGYYAVEPGEWQRLGRFGNYFKFTRVGLGVSNVHAAEDVVGLFDWFEISMP